MQEGQVIPSALMASTHQVNPVEILQPHALLTSLLKINVPHHTITIKVNR
jgi:hypothetical protein